ncbi:hypothetical protein D3C71_936820 [compost metagenome]
MPMNTHTVISIMPRSCSPRLPSDSVPQKSPLNTSSRKPIAAITRNTTIGTILATVTTALINAAWPMPRSTIACIAQSSTEAQATACQVLPSPKAGTK